MTLTYEWSARGVIGIGATLPTLTATASMIGKTVTVTVTGAETGYTTAAKTSTSTGPVSNISVVVTPIHVSGTTAASTIRSGSRPYVVDEAVSVAAGAALTVAAGTLVKFLNDTGLTVSGSLVSTGTAAAPVTFTSYQDYTAGCDSNGDAGASTAAPGNWLGISVEGTADLAHTVLKYARELISAHEFASGLATIAARPGGGISSGRGGHTRRSAPARSRGP